ncbi:Uncharacterised protein [uncultured Clostridium sp.]|nr:Uncharacterised protein [uncultured Clostridium sp.]
MLIKLNIDGELLELLKKDAEINCRTNPQQILYYLRQIYSGQLSVSNNTQVVQIEVPTVNQEVRSINNEVPTEVNIDNQQDTVDNHSGTNVVPIQEQEDFDYISDEMLNF